LTRQNFKLCLSPTKTPSISDTGELGTKKLKKNGGNKISSPDQMPAYVVGNAGINKIVTSEGSNLFSAFKNYIWMKQRKSSRTGASNLKKIYDEVDLKTEV
jgi:hypothetical protein